MKTVKPYKSANNYVTAYNDDDIEKLRPIIAKATHLWRTRCNEYQLANKQQGTYVMGAGIEIYHLAPRHRNPQLKMIISTLDITNSLRSLVWESSKEEVLNFLKSSGIDDASYNPGFMD